MFVEKLVQQVWTAVLGMYWFKVDPWSAFGNLDDVQFPPFAELISYI